MPEQMRPASKESAPDPSNNYERSHPENEAGMGRLDDNTRATPTGSPDSAPDAVPHAQDPSRQINAHEDRDARNASPAHPQSDHSMKDEDPLGWDQAPLDIQYPPDPREPRKGGTATPAEPRRKQ